MEEGKGKRIILFPLPFPGHFNPMIQLAGIFRRRGFSVTILHTSFNSPDISRHPNFTFRFLRENQNSPPQAEGSGSDLVAFLRKLDDKCASPFHESLAAELAATDGVEPVVCLVSDSIWSFTAAVADEVGICRVVLRTGGASSFCAFAALRLLKDKGYLPIQDSRRDEEVPQLSPLKVKDIPVIETKDPEDLYRLVNGMMKGAKSSSGIILNTFEDLEGSSLVNLRIELQVPIFPIGPFHKHYEDQVSTKDDGSIISWLDKKRPKSVVYVSFGSLAEVDEKEILEIAWGLRNGEQSFLWVVRPGLVRGTEWLEALPCGFIESVGQRGRIAKWVNQRDVLGHRAIGAFWTHCGWNSTLESICEGVPMICTPCFSDQQANARYICDVWRTGIPLERNKIDRREIEKAIRRMMVENEGDEMRKRGLKLKEGSNLCVKQDGSSYKSLDNLVSYVMSFNSFDSSKKVTNI